MPGTVEALSAGNITTVGTGVIIAIVVIGALLALLVTRLLMRVFLLVVVVVLAALVWQQRGHVENEVNKKACNLNATFFGIHVDAPDSVKRACRDHTS